MNNHLQTTSCEILEVKKESINEYTFKVKTDIKPNHGQFLQLSIPKFGEAPISVSEFGEGWIDFTIRSVGKVTEEIFNKKAGDTLFLRGPYGNNWPLNKLKGRNVVIVTGGTGLAPVKSILNYLYENPNYAESVTLISGFKNEEGIIFKNDLEKWKNATNFKAIYTLDSDKIDGWETGFVTEHIKNINFASFERNYEVIIVGPPMMMKFTAETAINHLFVAEDRIWVSFERKMSCAIGKCGHCRIDETYVCLNGPVFNYLEAKNLID